MANIEIRENGLGEFQVWRGNKVLRPGKLTWMNGYQSEHDFMYFDSLKQAEKEIERILKKEDEKVVKVYEIE